MNKMRLFYMWFLLSCESLFYGLISGAICIALVTFFTNPPAGMIFNMSIYISYVLGLFYFSFGLTTAVYLIHLSYLLLIKYTINPEFAVEDHLYDEYFKD